MAAHLTRDGGGPPPPGGNEVLLREAVDRLRHENARLLTVIATISVLLDTSPIGPTRADLATLAFQIRQVIDAAWETNHEG